MEVERGTNVERVEFEIRHHQMEIDQARDLAVTDMLKENSDETPADRIALSKADIILIYAIYQGGLKDFYVQYKSYVEECMKRRWKACDKPHWFLKRAID